MAMWPLRVRKTAQVAEWGEGEGEYRGGGGGGGETESEGGGGEIHPLGWMEETEQSGGG